MTGSVRYNRLIMPVGFQTSTGDTVVEFVVDTGFTGYLLLPLLAVQSIGLRYRDYIFALLADGTDVGVDRYEAVITWN